MRLFSILVALVVLGCQGGTPATPTSTSAQQPASQAPVPGAPSAPAATPGETSVVELGLDQTVSVGEVRLRWLDLNDSRCPLGVNCIWEGQAVVTLEVWRNDEAPQRIELTLRSGSGSAEEAVAGYHLRLLNVQPYPREGVTPKRSEYVATVEIKPL